MKTHMKLVSGWSVIDSSQYATNALTVVVLRRDVGCGGSNQRPFEQVGGDQVALECLRQANNDICGRLLIVSRQAPNSLEAGS